MTPNPHRARLFAVIRDVERLRMRFEENRAIESELQSALTELVGVYRELFPGGMPNEEDWYALARLAGQETNPENLV